MTFSVLGRRDNHYTMETTWCFFLWFYGVSFSVSKPNRANIMRPTGGSYPRPWDKESHALPTELAWPQSISNLFLIYVWGNIYVLVPIRTQHTTIVLDSKRERQCNSWRTLALHRGRLEEHWCASIDFDRNIILGCGHSRFSRLFRVSLQRLIFGHLWLPHFFSPKIGQYNWFYFPHFPSIDFRVLWPVCSFYRQRFSRKLSETST